MLDDESRLRTAATAGDADASAARVAHELRLQSKLRDIADAQAAEIAAAQAALRGWQERCFPSLPSVRGVSGGSDDQPTAGTDQAGGGRGGGGGGARHKSGFLPDLKPSRALQQASAKPGALSPPVPSGGFAPSCTRRAAR
jgi:hypothetical protein